MRHTVRRVRHCVAKRYAHCLTSSLTLTRSLQTAPHSVTESTREGRLSYWMTTLGLSVLSPFKGPLASNRVWYLPNASTESLRIRVFTPTRFRVARIVTGVTRRC